MYLQPCRLFFWTSRQWETIQLQTCLRFTALANVWSNVSTHILTLWLGFDGNILSSRKLAQPSSAENAHKWRTEKGTHCRCRWLSHCHCHFHLHFHFPFQLESANILCKIGHDFALKIKRSRRETLTRVAKKVRALYTSLLILKVPHSHKKIR